MLSAFGERDGHYWHQLGMLWMYGSPSQDCMMPCLMFKDKPLENCARYAVVGKTAIVAVFAGTCKFQRKLLAKDRNTEKSNFKMSKPKVRKMCWSKKEVFCRNFDRKAGTSRNWT